MDCQWRKRAFRPLLPDVRHISFNNQDELSLISQRTACVIVEPIQAEAGVVLPCNDYLQKLRHRCNQVHAMLIFDEAQTAMGRTGSMFAFEQEHVVPDMLLLAKALGGGMPLGALVGNAHAMGEFAHDPVLGHITTFGGHPVCCAASLAMIDALVAENLIDHVHSKGELFKSLLGQLPFVKQTRGRGLLLAVELAEDVDVPCFLQKMLACGLATDGFLHDEHAFRIAPPLIISEEQIEHVCRIISTIL
jgi:acetylornithine/succinyldiaminopimelate/putrescine aminotransferase